MSPLSTQRCKKKKQMPDHCERQNGVIAIMFDWRARGLAPRARQSIWTVDKAMWSVGTRLVLRIWSFTVVNRSGITWSDRLENVTEINQPWRAGRKPCRSTSRWWTTPSYQTTGNETQCRDSSAPVDECLGLFFILPCRTKCPSFLNKFGTLNQKGVWYMIL